MVEKYLFQCLQKNLVKPWYYWFLPQQFLYFLPDPHDVKTLVFIVLFVFIILLVFQYFQDQVTSILSVLFVLIYIINIYYPWTNRGHCPHPFTMDILLYLSINNKCTNNFLSTRNILIFLAHNIKTFMYICIFRFITYYHLSFSF